MAPGRVLAACLSSTRRLFQVRGADAVKYLHGNVTVNVTKLHSSGLYGAMLNVQGRILADVFMYPSTSEGPEGQQEPVLWVECDGSVLETVVQHLNKFKLRSKVTIEALPQDLAVWSIWSAEGSAEPLLDTLSNCSRAMVDARTFSAALRVVVPAGVKPSSSAAEVSEVPSEQYHVRRIVNAIPEGAVDLPFAKSFPFESNMDYMRGVHFDKGCYLGQEPTARAFFRGATRKRLL
eukprot:RCo042333